MTTFSWAAVEEELDTLEDMEVLFEEPLFEEATPSSRPEPIPYPPEGLRVPSRGRSMRSRTHTLDFGSSGGASITSSIPEIEINEMTTIGQMYRQSDVPNPAVNHPLVEGIERVGIEIELEGIVSRMPRSENWRQIGDGSLRNNGAEFVMRAPRGGNELYSAITELEAHLLDVEKDPSWRCSTHVHVDVRNMTEEQVRKFILGYTIQELLIFKCSGEHRYKNNFCMPLGFAQQQIQTLADSWNRTGQNFISHICGSWNKYTAMNLIPMTGQGSIEFRMAEPKWRKGHLLKLANRFLALKTIAIAHDGSEQEFVEYMAELDPLDLFKKGIPRGVAPDPQHTECGYKLAMDILQTAELNARSLAMTIRALDIPDFTMRTDIETSTRTHILDMVRIGSNNWTLNMFGLTEELLNAGTLNFLQFYRLARLTGFNPSNFMDTETRALYRDWREANLETIRRISDSQ